MAVVGEVASVAQLVSMIMTAAETARQNERDCEHIAGRVSVIKNLVPHLQDPELTARPEVSEPLEGLIATLIEAYELVNSCLQKRSLTYRFLMGRRQAGKFRDIEKRIDSHLAVIPFITYIGLNLRLETIHMHQLQGEASVPPSPASYAQLDSAIQSHGARLFTMEDIVAATNSFGNLLGVGDQGTVYCRGTLHDGQGVAVKRLMTTGTGRQAVEEAFWTELTVLSSLQHQHIVRPVGWCAEEEERLLVYEYASNGSLRDHLNTESRPSSVNKSWKMRIEILLGAARAIEYLHCGAQPALVHRDIKSSGILLDDSWTTRLSSFGTSVWRARDMNVVGNNDPASDVYSFGVVMLEVLTGKPPVVTTWDEVGEAEVSTPIVSFALPSIEAGKLGDVLDRRPGSKPSSRQLKALEMVANTAVRCLWRQPENRPAISDVVANLKDAFDRSAKISLFDLRHDDSVL